LANEIEIPRIRNPAFGSAVFLEKYAIFEGEKTNLDPHSLVCKEILDFDTNFISRGE
jgi:hypothetical protein